MEHLEDAELRGRLPLVLFLEVDPSTHLALERRTEYEAVPVTPADSEATCRLVTMTSSCTTQPVPTQSKLGLLSSSMRPTESSALRRAGRALVRRVFQVSVSSAVRTNVSLCTSSTGRPSTRMIASSPGLNGGPADPR